MIDRYPEPVNNPNPVNNPKPVNNPVPVNNSENSPAQTTTPIITTPSKSNTSVNIHKKIDKTPIPPNSLIIYIKTRIPNAYKMN